MTREQLIVEFRASGQQADQIVAKAQVLGCWPDDLWVEGVSHSADLLVTAGLAKGRPHTFLVSSTGALAAQR